MSRVAVLELLKLEMDRAGHLDPLADKDRATRLGQLLSVVGELIAADRAYDEAISNVSEARDGSIEEGIAYLDAVRAADRRSAALSACGGGK